VGFYISGFGNKGGYHSFSLVVMIVQPFIMHFCRRLDESVGGMNG